MNKEFSIVIPCTSLSGRITRTLHSISDDVEEITEVIIVYDSRIDEGYFLQDLQFSRLDILIVCANKRSGASEARNIGVKACMKPWVSFIDSDDVWLPGRYRLLKDHIYRYRQPLLVTGFERSYSLLPGLVVEHHRPSLSELGSRNSVCGVSGILVKRVFFCKVMGFTTGLPSCQDWDFFLRFRKRFEIRVVDKESYRYIQNTGSLTKRLMNVYRGRRYIATHFSKEIRGEERLVQLSYLKMLRKVLRRDFRLESLLTIDTIRFLRIHSITTLLFFVRNRKVGR